MCAGLRPRRDGCWQQCLGEKRCHRSFAGIPFTAGIAFAFILVVFPLVIAHGAGTEMQQTLGTAVFAGMIGVTLFGLFLTPLF